MPCRRSLLALPLLAVGCAALLALTSAQTRAADAKAATPAVADSAHAFAFTSIAGEPLPLSRYQGRPILLVNTASRCGFTDQYAGLQDLWDRYRDRGLVVLAVPSNDFRQELASEAEVKQFCEATFGVAFPMTEISHVTGRNAHPLYRWLGQELGREGRPRWNFHKVLIDGDGRPVAGWPSRVRPGDPAIVSRIERLLPTG
jgi:glutathione peroxidase